MPGEFEAKKVVVAGVVGVGRGCVEWFAREGATVGVLDPRASELCAQLDADGARLVPKDVELNDWAAISECARWWLDEYHGLDVLVNAHTATDYTGVEDAVIESVENVVSVNLVGPLVCSQAFLPGLKVSGAGAIVERELDPRVFRISEDGGVFDLEGRPDHPDPRDGRGVRAVWDSGELHRPGRADGGWRSGRERRGGGCDKAVRRHAARSSCDLRRVRECGGVLGVAAGFVCDGGHGGGGWGPDCGHPGNELRQARLRILERSF